MTSRFAPAAALGGGLLLLFCAPTRAQSVWVEFQDQTASRLVLSTVPLTDDQEKDVAPGDFDNDGDLDVVVARKVPFSNPGPLPDLLLMNENGVLTDRTQQFAPSFITTPDDSRDIRPFDADGDGWLDVVTANTFSQDPRLWINGGSQAGTWQGLVERANWFGPTFPVPPKFCAVYDGDIDNDGDLDLYFSDYKNSLEDRLLVNDGTGFFTDETAQRFPTGINSSSFGTGNFIKDFNGDGWADILKSSGSFEPLKLLLNDGNGVFSRVQSFGSLTPAHYMVVPADFDDDGRMDMYVVDDQQDYELMNDSTNADGTISVTKVMVTNSPRTQGFGGNVHPADVDCDGDQDIGVADVDVDIPGCNRRFTLLRNDFAQTGLDGLSDPNAAQTLPWNTRGTHDFWFLDIDGDGWLDVFQAHCTGYKVLIQVPGSGGNPTTYGTGEVGSNGQLAQIGFVGAPSSQAPLFRVTVTGGQPNSIAALFAGKGKTSVQKPWGTLLVTGPMFTRTLTQTDGQGNAAVDFPVAPALVGNTWHFQFLVRDLGSNGVQHSEGLEAFLCP